VPGIPEDACGRESSRPILDVKTLRCLLGVIRAPTDPLQTAKGEKFSPWLDKTCNQQKVEISEETPNFNVDPDSCIGTPP
jgi:hypothetical protein